ncbi:hypothetical protein [Luteococcus sanguinis]|uniref:Uncharacterized protein n=1 Tax=Luteococcus sanguinis TaxID=174038 RepID=A0ABW1X513_9ACTN
MRTHSITVLAASACLLLVACSGTDSATPGSSAGSTATGSVATSPPSASSIPAAPTTSSPSATASAPSNAAAPTASATPSASSASPAAETSVLTQVDAALFKQSTGYYFVSPSGHLHCGQLEVETGTLTGCQSDRVVANLPKCSRPTMDSAPIVTLSVDGAKADCTSQGVFNVEKARVLRYGQRLQLGDVTCTSQFDAVTCTDQSGASITASMQAFRAH